MKAEKIELRTKVNEVIAVQIERKNKENLIVALFYRSPSSQEENNKRIRQALYELGDNHNTQMVIMGDFNYKEINWEEDSGTGVEQEKFIECIQQNLLVQHVTEITRFRGNDIPSRVDLIFSTDEDMIGEIRYKSPLGKSDHKVITFKIKLDIEREIKEEMMWVYRKTKWKEMREDIEAIDWEQELKPTERSMNEIMEAFSERFNKLMEKHVPQTKIQKGKVMRPPLDEKMRELKKEKDKMCRRATEAKKTGNKYKYEKARTEYNRARNKVRSYSRKKRK